MAHTSYVNVSKLDGLQVNTNFAYHAPQRVLDYRLKTTTGSMHLIGSYMGSKKFERAGQAEQSTDKSHDAYFPW